MRGTQRSLAVGLLAVTTLLATMAQSPVARASTCPAVDAMTHVVTPAPSPGVDWSSCSLAFAELEYSDLSGANLAGADLGSANLFDTNLAGATMTGAKATGVMFGGANLTGVDLSTSNLQFSDFTGADLADVNLSGSILSHATLSGATLTCVRSGGIVGTYFSLPYDWRLVDGYLVGPGACLQGADLHGAALYDISSALDLSGTDLSGANLAGANLSYLTSSQNQPVLLAGADLTGATLTGAHLLAADLHAAKLDHVVGTGVWFGAGDLTDATFVGASLPGLDVIGADLTGADLTGADLTGGRLANVNLNGAVLTGATFSGVVATTGSNPPVAQVLGTPAAASPGVMVINGYLLAPGMSLPQANLAGLDLDGVDLNGANLQYADLSGASMVGADLHSVDLEWGKAQQTDLTDADLANIDPYGSNFSGCTLDGAHVTGVQLANVMLTGCSVDATDFADASFSGASTGQLLGTAVNVTAPYVQVGHAILGPHVFVTQTDLSGADLHGTDLSQAVFYGVDLAGANLANASLTGAQVQGGNWRGADLDSADIRGVALTNVDLANASLTGANFSVGSLAHVDLTNDDLSHAYLGTTSLNDVNFTQANLSWVVLPGSYDGPVTWLHTICPNGTMSEAWPNGCPSLYNSPPARVVGAQVGLVRRGVRLTWQPNTEIDIAGYSLFRYTTSRDFQTRLMWPPRNTTHFLDQTAQPGVTNRYILRALDPYSEQSRPVVLAVVPITPAVHQEDGFTYRGHWHTALDPRFCGGAARSTTDPGASMTYTFRGRGVAVVSDRSPNRGYIAVSVDGGEFHKVTLKAASPRRLAVAAWSQTLPRGKHTIVVKNVDSPRLLIDDIVVTS